MLWDRRNDSELPEELRGKKPEEIAAALRKAKEIEDALKAEEAKRLELEGKLTTQTTEFDTIKQKLADVEARLTPPPPPPDDDEPASPWTDPQKFVAEQTRGVAGIALTSGMMTAKMYFTQQLSTRDAKIFKKYEKEVEQGVNTFAPEARVMPQSWFNMFLYVKGAHEQDIKKAETENTDYFSETPSRGTTHVADDEPVDKLTAAEEEVCRTFHYDPKAYLERKKSAVAKRSERGEYATYKVASPVNR